jgi:hypothetical protein
MIGVPVQHTLATACEQRLGRIVDAATTFDLHRLSSPAGSLKLRTPLRLVLALTDTDIWLLEFRHWVVGFTIGATLGRFPRRGLAPHWRHRRWAWPAVWKAELSWPETATYVEGAMIGGEDADRIMGLLASDELRRELGRSAPALG